MQFVPPDKKTCYYCRHLDFGSENFPACVAYPNHIPIDIWNGERLHERPLADQVGETVREARRSNSDILTGFDRGRIRPE